VIGKVGNPLPRQRRLVLASLVAVTAAAWAAYLVQSLDGGGGMAMAAAMPPPAFLASWTVMMAAMMFPAAAPMILTFASVHGARSRRGDAFVPSWVFAASYLVVWVLFGALAYAASAVLDASAGRLPWVELNGTRLLGGLLLLAALYQLSPLKHACLSRCRSPLAFLAGSWREGVAGAFRMGLEHGVLCLGCCWPLFLLLFPLGVMNLGAMTALTLLVFVEKTSAIGPRVARLTAPALGLAGAALALGAVSL
jgi:predicted metal-binding membrane protein